jgi:hypothetical protein
VRHASSLHLFLDFDWFLLWLVRFPLVHMCVRYFGHLYLLGSINQFDANTCPTPVHFILGTTPRFGTTLCAVQVIGLVVIDQHETACTIQAVGQRCVVHMTEACRVNKREKQLELNGCYLGISENGRWAAEI